MYEEMAERNALELTAQHGEVLQVELKPNEEIEVTFAGGVKVILGSIFRFGYRGTGATCFVVWLRTAGFEVTDDDVARMKAPLTLKKGGPLVTGAKPAIAPTTGRHIGTVSDEAAGVLYEEEEDRFTGDILCFLDPGATLQILERKAYKDRFGKQMVKVKVLATPDASDQKKGMRGRICLEETTFSGLPVAPRPDFTPHRECFLGLGVGASGAIVQQEKKQEETEEDEEPAADETVILLYPDASCYPIPGEDQQLSAGSRIELADDAVYRNYFGRTAIHVRVLSGAGEAGLEGWVLLGDTSFAGRYEPCPQGRLPAHWIKRVRGFINDDDGALVFPDRPCRDLDHAAHVMKGDRVRLLEDLTYLSPLGRSTARVEVELKPVAGGGGIVTGWVELKRTSFRELPAGPLPTATIGGEMPEALTGEAAANDVAGESEQEPGIPETSVAGLTDSPDMPSAHDEESAIVAEGGIAVDATDTARQPDVAPGEGVRAAAKPRKSRPGKSARKTKPGKTEVKEAPAERIGLAVYIVLLIGACVAIWWRPYGGHGSWWKIGMTVAAVFVTAVIGAITQIALGAILGGGEPK